MSWQLHNQALEIRYTKGYTYLDKAGSICRLIADKFPGFELGEADPTQTEIHNTENGVILRMGSSRAAIVGDSAFVSASTYAEYATYFFKLITTELQISTLTRIGNRNIYQRTFATASQVSEFISLVSTVNMLGAAAFQTSEDQRLKGKKLAEVTLRFEDEKTGISFALKPGEVGYRLKGNINPTIQERLPRPSPAALLDVDVYTLLPMPVDDFDADLLLKSNIKMIESRLLQGWKNFS